MTTQLDLAGLHNAGTKLVSRGQAIAAPAWPTSCHWDSLVMAVNGFGNSVEVSLIAERMESSEQPTHQPAAAPAHRRTHACTLIRLHVQDRLNACSRVGFDALSPYSNHEGRKNRNYKI